ncbi:trypsin-like peptidase domain-containing protein [bacterium]|nr:trypsin-like peptidase domain-containing protein [bacterium]
MKKEQQPIFLVQGDQNWLQVESAAQNTVVQIFAQVGQFNWLEPYKVKSQYESRGTGFFINDQGYIITNAHVVNEAKTVWITIPALGRDTIKVEVISFCPDRDIALLRITPQDLQRVKERLGKVPFLMIGDSDVVRRTEKVLVLGYPLGQHRMKSTTGVVSGRESTNSISYIQITAPINSGSSGGPLIAANGTVIGVTVAVAAEALNIGYAIPINELKVIFEDLLKNPLVRKPILGGNFHNATDEHAKFLGNPVPAGLYTHKVFKGSLFEKSGVCPGDMIYQINGYTIDSHGEAKVPWSMDKVSIYDLVSRLVVGQKVELVLYRFGEKKEINFVLEPYHIYSVRVKYPDYERIEHEVVGGMIIMELALNHIPFLVNFAPNLLKYQKIENMIDPVLVIAHILPGSYAQKLRCLTPGVIIKEVNNSPVETISEFRVVLKKGMRENFLSLKTDDDVLAVFPFKKMLAEEERLSTDFAYSLTQSVRELLDLVGNGE